MCRFCNNRGSSVNILTATNTDNRTTAVTMRRQVNTPLKRENNIGETVFSMWSAPSKRTEQ
jgi:hypothetical protein